MTAHSAVATAQRDIYETASNQSRHACEA